MTWLDVPVDLGFGIDNLPFGSFSLGGGARRLGIAIGGHVLDVGGLARSLLTDGGEQGLGGFADVLSAPVLNPLLAAGWPAWTAVRSHVQRLLGDPAQERVVRPNLYPVADATLHLPLAVGDYVDFYASEYHAANVGRIFRPGGDPLTPNWRYMPIGYHGRAGSVVVSGTDVRRPQGQRRLRPDARPEVGPTTKLDIEAEIGFVVGGASGLGEPVPVQEFERRVFGAFILNDWSARDIQSWEYVPLGPFLGKSFATSVSPWIVPLDALGPARIPPPPREPELLPYLRDAGDWGLDLQLTVTLNGHRISRPTFRHMYWTPAQQLAHMTVNGAPARPGDIYASGTVSGPDPDSWGSLLELTHDGRDPLSLPDGSTRSYLEDGDVVTIAATAPGRGGARISLGSVEGRILAPG
jgi:fumarylacetoacetase